MSPERSRGEATTPEARHFLLMAGSSMNDVAWIPDSKRLLYADNDALWMVDAQGDPRPILQSSNTIFTSCRRMAAHRGS